MKRLMLWLCSKGWHRGDMLWTPRVGSTINCNTCGQVVENKR